VPDVFSKNKKPPTAAERRHIVKVKELPCSVCDEPGPSDAHEINQGQWFTSIALCKECHQSPVLGIHGLKRMWAIKKMDELGALNVTIKRLMEAQ
jgi:hypothetical protein